MLYSQSETIYFKGNRIKILRQNQELKCLLVFRKLSPGFVMFLCFILLFYHTNTPIFLTEWQKGQKG